MTDNYVKNSLNVFEFLIAVENQKMKDSRSLLILIVLCSARKNVSLHPCWKFIPTLKVCPSGKSAFGGVGYSKKIKSLNNSAYELIPLKKYLGTSASFMSEWIDEAKWVPISICKYELTYACKSLECRLPETFGVLPLKSDHNEYAEFEVDEKILGLIPKAVGLIRKIQNDTELSSDEEIIIRNYAQIQIADLDSQFKQLSDLHIKYSQDESKTEETRKMWRDSVTRLTREYQTERNNLLNTDYAKKASLKRLQKDIETLVSVKGFAMLYKDLDNMNDEAISEISREGVSAPGSIMIDLHDLNHIIYRGIGPSGKPAFTIIDQYHLGAGELEHKRRVHGDTRPHIGLRMGP